MDSEPGRPQPAAWNMQIGQLISTARIQFSLVHAVTCFSPFHGHLAGPAYSQTSGHAFTDSRVLAPRAAFKQLPAAGRPIYRSVGRSLDGQFGRRVQSVRFLSYRSYVGL